MRSLALLAPMLLFVAGCTTPFSTPPTLEGLAEVTADFRVAVYDSEDDGATDGIAITLRTARPNPPLVGSDAVLVRNGDGNVTVWRCPEREANLCDGNRGILSWDVGETIYIRGLPGENRLEIRVKDRYAYNTTVMVEETRDTEVWAVLRVDPYDSDGNATMDGLRVSLVASDKAPFDAEDVRIHLNQVVVPVFRNPERTTLFGGRLVQGSQVFVDGFLGENRVEVFLKETRYDLGRFQIGE